jgi:transposase
MDDANMKTWWSRELAEHLSIGGSTLRKWSLELEKAGYVFLRDELGRRAYVEHDAIALRQLKKALDSGKSYDSATKSITAEYYRTHSDEITLSAKADFPVDEERYDALDSKIDAQAEQIAQLIEMNRALFVRLDEREDSIQKLTEIVTTQKAIAAAGEDRQEERERKRDEQVTQILRELQETRAAANKSLWKRMFGG